mgnify:FL=1
MSIFYLGAGSAILLGYIYSTNKQESTIYQLSKDVKVTSDAGGLVEKYKDNLNEMPILPGLYARQGLLGENQWDVIRASGDVEVTKKWISPIQEQTIVNNFDMNEWAFTKDPEKKRIILTDVAVKPLFVNLRSREQDPQLYDNYPFTYAWRADSSVPAQDTDAYYYEKSTDILSNGHLDSLNLHNQFNRNTPWNDVNVYRGEVNRGSGYSEGAMLENHNSRRRVKFA